MPDRIIRDEILDSERWLAVENVGKLAFLACALKCDAMGNMDAQPLRLYRLWRDFGAGTVEASEDVLKALEAVDLVRSYTVDKKRFIHIPRFGQRVRYVGRLHPKSPWDAEQKPQKQPDTKKSPGEGQAQAVPQSGAHMTVTGRSEVKRSEVKRSEVDVQNPSSAPEPAFTAKPVEKGIEGNSNDESTEPPEKLAKALANFGKAHAMPGSVQRSREEQLAYVAQMTAKGAA